MSEDAPHTFRPYKLPGSQNMYKLYASSTGVAELSNLYLV